MAEELDTDRVAQIRRLLVQPGGEALAEQRFGEHVAGSEEYQKARAQLSAQASRQRSMREEAVAASEDKARRTRQARSRAGAEQIERIQEQQRQTAEVAEVAETAKRARPGPHQGKQAQSPQRGQASSQSGGHTPASGDSVRAQQARERVEASRDRVAAINAAQREKRQQRAEQRERSQRVGQSI